MNEVLKAWVDWSPYAVAEARLCNGDVISGPLFELNLSGDEKPTTIVALRLPVSRTPAPSSPTISSLAAKVRRAQERGNDGPDLGSMSCAERDEALFGPSSLPERITQLERERDYWKAECKALCDVASQNARRLAVDGLEDEGKK